MRLVLILKPADVVAERPAGRRRRLTLALDRLVAVQHLEQYESQTPAIDRDVVDTPKQLAVVLIELKDGEPRQRRVAGIEATPAIRREIRREPRLLLGRRESPPIMKIHRQIELGVDDLIGTTRGRPVDR